MAVALPVTFKKLIVNKLTNKFNEAVKIVEATVSQLAPNEVLVRNRFVGINATEVNVTAGAYHPGATPPLDFGFEGHGLVVAVGSDVKIKVGQAVFYGQMGAFAEYTVVPEPLLVPVPAINAAFITFPISGLTASISLEQYGELKKGETVLITAAAGGTGQFAVQLAKLAGCHVIGTCSSADKVTFLKSIGCDRVIDYTKENLKEVLEKEYSKGIDVVYETIGGEVFETCVDALAVRGRILVIGAISGYLEASMYTYVSQGLPLKFLRKSASLRGFFILDWPHLYAEHLGRLIQLFSEGKLKVTVDNGTHRPKGPLKGLEEINDAVEYLYSKKSIGKIVVEFPDSGTQP